MKWIKKLLPLLIICAGIAIFGILVSLRQEPERVEQVYVGPLVEVIEAPPQKINVTIEGQGTVRPDAQINLIPQVSGKIIWKNQSFKSGGSFSMGDTLCRIDPRDYELATRQANAEVLQAQYRYDVAKEESNLARREWQRIHGKTRKPSDLVLQLPQLRSAEATVAAAKARAEERTLKLERTILLAPFKGRVRNVQADVGQHINAGQPIAQLYSIEGAEIVVPIPDEDLAWFTLPLPVAIPGSTSEGRNSVSKINEKKENIPLNYDEVGAEVLVEGVFAGQHSKWSGRVTRTEGEIDPKSRMARIIVEVNNPYGNITKGGPPLMVGMFVNVKISGRFIENVRVIPRSAIRSGQEENLVWVCDKDNHLRFRQVEILRKMQDKILINVEINTNERIIVSQLSGATDGMSVRIANTQKEFGS